MPAYCLLCCWPFNGRGQKISRFCRSANSTVCIVPPWTSVWTGMTAMEIPLWIRSLWTNELRLGRLRSGISDTRSEEHTSELQSQSNLVCRLLLEKYKAFLQHDDVQPDMQAERDKTYEIEVGTSYYIRRFGDATCDDKSSQIDARFYKNNSLLQPA